MIILACDTSGNIGSCALLDNDRPLAVLSEKGGAHSATFLPMVLRLLTDAGAGFADIGLYACATGPGSFTGIRIGVATVQGMAFAAGRPAIGVTSLEALAWPLSGRAGELVCPVIDARNDRVYAQVFLDGVPVMAPAALAVDALLEALDALPGRQSVVFCGDAADAVAVRASMRPGAHPVGPPAHRERAAVWIGQAALPRFLASPDRFEPQSLLPFYLGRSQAERARGIDAAAWQPPPFER